MGIKIMGQWRMQGGQIVESPECSTIKKMIQNELVEVSDREGGWVKLFKHKDTGEFWELDYPQSEMHGGGPPLLENLTAEEAKARYGGNIS